MASDVETRRRPNRRGRLLRCYLDDDEWADIEAVRVVLGTRSARATITRAVRVALTLGAEALLDRRHHHEPVAQDRRTPAPGRRSYDGARAMTNGGQHV